MTPLEEEILQNVDKSILEFIDNQNDIFNKVQYAMCVPISNIATQSFKISQEELLIVDSAYIGWDSFNMMADYDFFQRLKVIDDLKLANFIKILQSNCFSIYEFEKEVFAIEPPITIITDKEGEFHSLSEQALKFQDGFAYYFIHGKLMPDWIFQGFNQTDLDEMTDIDIKQGMTEILKTKNV